MHPQAACALRPRRACALFTESALQAEAGVRMSHTRRYGPGQALGGKPLGCEQEMARHWSVRRSDPINTNQRSHVH